MENKKNIKIEEGDDRISSLPDPILVDILSLLETKYAVRTSSLSTKWKHLWTSVPNLIFDLRDMYPETGRLLPSIFFINRVLVFYDHPPRIHKFSLTCGYTQWRIVSDFFNAWMVALIRGGVQSLHIDVSIDYPDHRSLDLPPSLFTCETLVDLRLGGEGGYFSRVVLGLPDLVLFPNLKRLYLKVYTPSDDLTSRLFSSCPVLESLSIDAVLEYSEVNFNICVQNLKELTIVLKSYGYGDCKHKVVIDAPFVENLSIKDNLLGCYSMNSSPSSLVKACIDVGEGFWRTLGHDRSNYLFELLRGISDVKSLQLSDHTTRALDYAANYGQFVFPNLNRLELIVTCWSKLLGLLERMPYLESLELIKNIEGVDPNKKGEVSGAKNGDHIEYSGHSQAVVVPGCLLSHLKLVKVDAFTGREDQLQLVKYFLKNAKVLNKMIIVFEDLASEEVGKFLTKLVKFPRGSETCQIEFSGLPALPSRPLLKF